MSTTAARKRLSHSQYEELRTYESGNPSWRFHAPGVALTRNGWLMREPNSGETRRDSAFKITDAGRAALAEYRVRYGVQS